MSRSWYARLVLLLSLCVLAVYLLYPSYVFYFQASQAQRDNHAQFCQSLPSWAHCAKLNLGLDLQGGVHLVMGVRVDKALEQRADRIAEALRTSLKEKAIPFSELERPRDSSRITLSLASSATPEMHTTLDKLLRQNFPYLDVQRQSRPAATPEAPAQSVLTLNLNADEARNVRDSAVEQSIKTIRNRADKLGVTEPTIARRGSDQILIQLPGINDPQHAIAIIGRTAQLEFTMLSPSAGAAWAHLDAAKLPAGAMRRQEVGQRRGTGEAAEVYFELPEAQKAAFAAAVQEAVPAAAVLAFGKVQLANGLEKADTLRTYLLQSRPGITGDYLVNAQVQQDQERPSEYFVTMSFDPQGAKIFEKLTQEHVGEPMAIVLDGTVISAPTIQEKIAGGTGRITLGRSIDPRTKFEEAKDLALVLKAGALPAPVEVREKRQVGKTLGQDTVAKGTFAMAVGTALVVLFMALYYKGSGMMANVALLLNVLFMMGFLALLEATLTLPGMAGIVLTIGMAVDANVLIFERIREELRAGKTPRSAIDAGHKKAFGTIFDSNITTMIAGVVLMQYGSGPVRGFAITLLIGLTCSLYTAIVVTRLIYDFRTSRGNLAYLSI